MFGLTGATRALFVATACFALAAAGMASSRRLPARSAPSKTHSEVAVSRSAGEAMSLDLKDADLKDVLRTFGKLAKVNIAIDPEVRGSVTLRLRDLPWDQALDVILRINGLGYVLEGNILRVGTPSRLLAEN
jgi:type IV pilus assembly protein PilQ